MSDRKVYNREYYLRNREREIERALEKKRVTKAWVDLIKQLFGCRDCPTSNPIVLDFHHVGIKREKVSTLLSNGHSKARILEEIGKCVVLCANCHRLEHSRRGDLID